MSWYRRRKRDYFDDFLDDFLEELDRMEEMIRGLMRETFTRDLERAGEGKPLIYGVRITVGPDGVPRIEEFGNVKMTRTGKPLLRDEIEPLVDVMEVDDEVWVIAELPGVNKEKISVKATGTRVYIRAENDRKYYKEVDLPVEVDADTAKASYRNGVLEVKLKKKTAKKEEGKEVKVE